ncbi:MAG: hypothetical protein ABJL99_19960 [Aliishimia sp.]
MASIGDICLDEVTFAASVRTSGKGFFREDDGDTFTAELDSVDAVVAMSGRAVSNFTRAVSSDDVLNARAGND